MKLLVVGGAGMVGQAIAPALEAAHQVRHFDRAPAPGAEDRTIVADVNDEAKIAQAVAGIEALLYLAVGTKGKGEVNDVKLAFDVNLQGFYRFASAAAAAGVKKIIYTSTLSVYENFRNPLPFPEDLPADAWHVYGLTKRLGEEFCKMLSMKYPEATVIVLRLNFPCHEKMYAKIKFIPELPHSNIPLGPADMSRAYLAALECARPGCHVVHVAADPNQMWFKISKARELLAWEPRGG